MKTRFEYVTINFKMFKGTESTKKSQGFPICKERVFALKDIKSAEFAAANDIVKNITFLCGYERYIILSFDERINILGGENFE